MTGSPSVEARAQFYHKTAGASARKCSSRDSDDPAYPVTNYPETGTMWVFVIDGDERNLEITDRYDLRACRLEKLHKGEIQINRISMVHEAWAIQCRLLSKILTQKISVYEMEWFEVVEEFGCSAWSVV